jgi:hypothetical protein
MRTRRSADSRPTSVEWGPAPSDRASPESTRLESSVAALPVDTSNRPATLCSEEPRRGAGRARLAAAPVCGEAPPHVEPRRLQADALAFLIAALVAPLAGPILYGLLHGHARAVRVVDGSVYVAVPVLLAWQVLPAAWESRSLWMLVAVAAGLLVPTALERASHALQHLTDSVALTIGLSGLVLHTFLEGAALVPAQAGHQLAFVLAVTLHRIPVGLVVWWLLRPRYGSGVAAAGVGSILVGTALGYALGMEVLGSVTGQTAEIYQAFVSGSLVHVVFHQGRHDHAH